MGSHLGVITRKGQVTIPVDIRRELGLEVGDTIVFERDETGVRLENAKERSLRTVRETAGMFSKHVDRSHLTAQELLDLDEETIVQAVLDDWHETERRMGSDDSTG